MSEEHDSRGDALGQRRRIIGGDLPQSDEPENTSFAQNVHALESLLFRMEVEFDSDEPDLRRLIILRDDHILLREVIAKQFARIVESNGTDDPIIMRFKSLRAREEKITERFGRYIERGLRLRRELEEKLDALEKVHASTRRELGILILDAENSGDKELESVLRAELQKETDLGIEQMKALGAEARRQVRAPIDPPKKPPVDTKKEGGDDGGMNERISALEKDMAQVKTDVAVMRSNYATKDDIAGATISIRDDLNNLKTRVETELPHLATKAFVQETKDGIRTWFIASVLVLIGILLASHVSQYNMLKSAMDDRFSSLKAVIESSRTSALAQQQLPAPSPAPKQ